VLQALVQHFEEGKDQLKSVVVGSPGFVKDGFYQYMQEQAAKSQSN
jgi:stalled ribosome rescue protein Dom34